MNRHLCSLGIVVAAALGGCAPAPDATGSWQSAQPVGSAHNTLDVRDDGHATATLHILYVENGAHVVGRFELDADWRYTGASEVRFDMTCQRTPFGDCEPSDDFHMSCKYDEASDQLSCQGENNWKDYDFEWQRMP